MNNPLQCIKCAKIFSTIQKKESHDSRKILCDAELNCNKCGKEFSSRSNLVRHENRKSSCKPIKGDPTIKAINNQCIYCRNNYKSKYSLNRHYNICKIKNGGMDILFDEIKKLKDEVKTLKECKTGSIINSINIGVQNNHFNTTLNFNLIDFGGGAETIKEILQGPGLQLLENKFMEDLPIAQQISDRVVNLVGLVFRNPDHKELQSIYVIDPGKIKDNAYYHDDGKWVLGDWNNLRRQLLQNMHFYYDSIKNKNDAEGIMKLIFKLSMDTTDSRMTREETTAVLTDIGKYLKFDTIVL